MSDKHVHFSACTSYCTCTPSPISSISTLPLSEELIGLPPPSDISPERTAPLPKVFATALHPCLIAKTGEVIFDLSLPPSNIHFTTPTPIMLEMPATMPPSPSMSIICTHLPWTVTIIPRSPIGVFVTVLDVFETLYIALCTPVTAKEYGQLPGPEAQDCINRAFRSRCKRDGAEQFGKGLRRIDFLGSHVTFRGFEPVEMEDGKWTLQVS